MKNKVERKPNPNSRYVRIWRVNVNRMFPVRQDALKVALSVFAGVFIGIWPMESVPRGTKPRGKGLILQLL